MLSMHAEQVGRAKNEDQTRKDHFLWNGTIYMEQSPIYRSVVPLSYWSWSYKNTTQEVKDQVLLGQTGLVGV